MSAILRAISVSVTPSDFKEDAYSSRMPSLVMDGFWVRTFTVNTFRKSGKKSKGLEAERQRIDEEIADIERPISTPWTPMCFIFDLGSIYQAGRPGSIRLSSRRQPGPIQRWKGLTIISVGIVYHSRLWRLPPGEIDER